MSEWQEQKESTFDNDSGKWTNWIIGLVIGVPLLFMVISVASSNSGETPQNNESVAVANEKPEEKQESLAEKVDEQYKNNWGITSYTDFLISEDYPAGSLVGYINKMEDVSKGTIRVYVQADVTEEEAKGLAKNVLGMVGMDIEELDWVIVRGVEGRDYQASRNEIPALR